MTTIFLPAAFAEIEEAHRFYTDRRAALGERFRTAVERAISQIEHHPRRWPLLDHATRKRQLDGFPYLVLYRIHAGHIVVIAVAHMSRRPGYWRDRQ